MPRPREGRPVSSLVPAPRSLRSSGRWACHARPSAVGSLERCGRVLSSSAQPVRERIDSTFCRRAMSTRSASISGTAAFRRTHAASTSCASSSMRSIRRSSPRRSVPSGRRGRATAATSPPAATASRSTHSGASGRATFLSTVLAASTNGRSCSPAGSRNWLTDGRTGSSGGCCSQTAVDSRARAAMDGRTRGTRSRTTRGTSIESFVMRVTSWTCVGPRRSRTTYVSRKRDVARLDDFVGPKR